MTNLPDNLKDLLDKRTEVLPAVVDRQSSIAKHILSLALVFGKPVHTAPSQKHQHSRLFSHDFGAITANVRCPFNAKRPTEFKAPTLTLRQGAFTVVFSGPKGIHNPTAMYVKNGDGRNVDVMGVEGPWNIAYENMLKQLEACIAEHDEADLSCTKPPQAELCRAAHVFKGEEIPQSKNTIAERMSFLKTLSVFADRTDGNFSIDELGVTITKVEHNSHPILTIETDKVQIKLAYSPKTYKYDGYYSDRRRTVAEKWTIKNFTVKAQDSTYEVKGSSGVWHDYANDLAQNIHAWIGEQPTEQEFAKAKREAELASAALTFSDDVQLMYQHKLAKELDDKNRLAREKFEREEEKAYQKKRAAEEREAKRQREIAEWERQRATQKAAEERARLAIIEEQEAARRAEEEARRAEASAHIEQEIVNSRDFLIQQLGVDKIPAPSKPEVHKKRGRFSRLIGKS